MATYDYSTKDLKENMAKAVARDCGVSTKYAIETVQFLKNRTTAQAKAYLEKVIAQKAAIPFKRFTNGVGHRKGPNMAAGRYPRKLSIELIRLLKNVEANASLKGLGDNLKIVYFIANKAAVPMRYGRHPRRETKRTHIEIVVEEVEEKRIKSNTKKKISDAKNVSSIPKKDKTLPIIEEKEKLEEIKNNTPIKTDTSEANTIKNNNTKNMNKSNKESKNNSEPITPKKESESVEKQKKSTPIEESKND